jgi:hypothetical protein
MFDDYFVADLEFHIACEGTILSCGGDGVVFRKLKFAFCELFKGARRVAECGG